MPIFLLAAAGAMLFGGAGLLKFAKDEQARDEARRAIDAEHEILSKAVDLEELKEKARAKGLDPDEVVAGHLAINDGTVNLDDVVDFLTKAA